MRLAYLEPASCSFLVMVVMVVMVVSVRMSGNMAVTVMAMLSSRFGFNGHMVNVMLFKNITDGIFYLMRIIVGYDMYRSTVLMTV